MCCAITMPVKDGAEDSLKRRRSSASVQSMSFLQRLRLLVDNRGFSRFRRLLPTLPESGSQSWWVDSLAGCQRVTWKVVVFPRLSTSRVIVDVRDSDSGNEAGFFGFVRHCLIVLPRDKQELLCPREITYCNRRGHVSQTHAQGTRCSD